MAYDQTSQYQPPQRDYLSSRTPPATAYTGYGDSGYAGQQGHSQSRQPLHNEYDYSGSNGQPSSRQQPPPADDYGFGNYQYAEPGRAARKPPSVRSNGSGRSPGGPSPGYGQTPRKQSSESRESDRDINRAMGDMTVSGNGYGQAVSQQRRPGTSNSNRSNHSGRNDRAYGGGYGQDQGGYGQTHAGYASSPGGYNQGQSSQGQGTNGYNYGPGQGQNQGHGGYGQQGLRAERFQGSHTVPSSPARDFHPSYERSMTMPVEGERHNVPRRQASDRGPYNAQRSHSDRSNQYGDHQQYSQAPKDDYFELDSYYGGTSEPYRQSPEEEMPNFDLPAQAPAHKRGMSIEKHLGNRPGSRNGQGRGFDSAGAHRSRSQPDLRGQNARGPPGGAAPPMPGYNGQPAGRGAYQNGIPPRGGYGPPGRGRGGPMPRGGPNMRGPGPGPGPSPGYGPPGSRRPPNGQMRGAPPGRGGPPGRGNFQNGPVRSGSNGQSPDALPQHPAPVRPGLMQESSSQIPPRTDSRGPPNQPPEPISQDTSPVTYKQLEDLRRNAANNPNDRRLQLTLAKKLVEAGSVLADDGGRADARTKKANRDKFFLDAHKIVKKLVSAGSAEAMFYLADCYGQGDMGLETDNREAFKLYQSAAKMGHAQAAYRTAVCCEIGQEDGGGTSKDPLKAVEWYKRSAAMGDCPGMYKMGMIQLKGLLGQPRNPREAVVWLKRAADQADEDNPHALHELGLLYQNASPNDSIIKDEGYARQLFFQAAELGYKFSQFRLGAAHEFGSMGCPIDPRTSIAWYSRAAVQEEHQSELALSGWYLTGTEGILQQSDTEAYLWARKAAQAGLSKAEYAMGYFTEVGIGCPPNMEEAKRWYQRAAGQNFTKARERLDEIRRGGPKAQKSRERLSRSKAKEGDCVVM